MFRVQLLPLPARDLAAKRNKVPQVINGLNLYWLGPLIFIANRQAAIATAAVRVYRMNKRVNRRVATVNPMPIISAK